MASCFEQQQSGECPLMRLLHKAIDLLANGIAELCRRLRSVFRLSRKGQRFTAEQVEEKVMRLARNSRSRLAKDVKKFIEAMKRRPIRNPDGDWKDAFIETRYQMTTTRNYLARKLGTGDSEEEQDALERCVEKLMYEPVRNELHMQAMVGLWMETCIRDMMALVRRHRTVGLPPSRLGAPELSPVAREKLRKQMYSMQSARLPCDKIDLLVSVAEQATLTVEQENGITINSDNLLPLMSWMLVDTGNIYALIEAEMLQALLPPEKDCGKASFYLTTLYCACLTINTRPQQPRQAPTYSTATPVANIVTCDEVPVSVKIVTLAEATEAGDCSGCDDENPIDDNTQEAEPDADTLTMSSEGYGSDPDREVSPEPLEPFELLNIATANRKSHFADDELSSESKTPFSSWSSNLDLDSLSAGNDLVSWGLRRSVSSDESLGESDCVNSKTAQIDSAGTLFSAVPMFLSRTLMA